MTTLVVMNLGNARFRLFQMTSTPEATVSTPITDEVSFGGLVRELWRQLVPDCQGDVVEVLVHRGGVNPEGPTNADWLSKERTK